MQVYLAIGAVVAILGYYLVVWLTDGRDPAPGTRVIQYAPPDDVSPAMMRYVWREDFDDRVLWSGVLSLVAKGLATLTPVEGGTAVTAKGEDIDPGLPEEERVLLEQIVLEPKRKLKPFNMLDGNASYAAIRMARTLREAGLGRWFVENRQYVLYGVIFSLGGITLVARPRGDEWMALAAALGVGTPSAFYLFLLARRLRELIRAVRRPIHRDVLARLLIYSGFLLPVAAGLGMGSLVIGVTFGWPTLLATWAMVTVNGTFLFLMKAPTPSGRDLLDKIDGFREYLQSVEKHPMDRPDAPHADSGVYEKYLPYAVALEVEQAWGDRCVALADTFHQQVAVNAHSFYLGMWNGKPVEIVWSSRTNARGQSY